MHPRTLGLLLLAAALLGGGIWWLEVRGGSERQEAEAQAKRLFPGLDAKQVEWIALTTLDGRPARLARTADGWQVVEPVAFPADEINADGMASALAELASEREIENAEAPAVYGLDDTARSVRFLADAKEHALRIGKKTPVGSSTYVRVDDSPAIHIVPTYRANGFLRSLDELREKRILRFDRSSIERVELEWAGGGATLAKQGGTWKLLAPIEAPADEVAVDGLLANLSYLRADGFEDSPATDAQTGLDAPDLRVVLVAKPPTPGAEAPRFRLAIGRTADRRVRFARSDAPTLYRIAAERIDDFPRTVGAYRFKELARFDAAAARRIEIVFHGPGGDVTKTLSRGENGWTADGETLVAGKADRLVTELSHLRGKDVVEGAQGTASLAPLGLAPPQAVLRVLGDGAGGEAPVLAAVELGHGDPKDPKAGIPARAVGGTLVVQLEHSLGEHLPLSAEAWRDRFVQSGTPAPGATAAPPSGAPAPAPPAGEGQGAPISDPDGAHAP